MERAQGCQAKGQTQVTAALPLPLPQGRPVLTGGPPFSPPRHCGPAPEVSHLRGMVSDTLCFTKVSPHAASYEQPRERAVLSVFKLTKLRLRLSSELPRAVRPESGGAGEEGPAQAKGTYLPAAGVEWLGPLVQSCPGQVG